MKFLGIHHFSADRHWSAREKCIASGRTCGQHFYTKDASQCCCLTSGWTYLKLALKRTIAQN